MEQLNEQVQTPSEGANVESSVDMDKIYSDIESKVRDSFKAELSGLHRKVSELEKEKEQAVQAVKEEKLTETQKLQMQLEEIRAEQLRSQRELTVEKNKGVALEFMQANNIPSDFASMIDLTSTDGMTERLSKIKELAEGIRNKTAEELARSGGSGAPKGANSKYSKVTTKADLPEISDAMAYIKEHGKEAFNALPEK